MSALNSGGPKNPFRVGLPKAPLAGRDQGPRVQPLAFSSGVATAVATHPVPLVPGVAVANQPLALGFDTLASPTRFARHTPVSWSCVQSAYPGVNGNPVSHVHTLLNCHPPIMASAARGIWVNTVPCVPNGRS